MSAPPAAQDRAILRARRNEVNANHAAASVGMAAIEILTTGMVGSDGGCFAYSIIKRTVLNPKKMAKTMKIKPINWFHRILVGFTTAGTTCFTNFRPDRTA